MSQTGTLKLDLTLPSNAAPLAFGANDWTHKELSFPVVFSKRFDIAPLVMLGIVAIETDPTLPAGGTDFKPNLDLSVLPREITLSGFNILLRVGHWNTTASLNVSWLAIEP